MDTPDDNDQIKDDHGRLPPPKVLLERERLARQELWSTTSLQATFLNENGTISAIDSFGMDINKCLNICNLTLNTPINADAAMIDKCGCSLNLTTAFLMALANALVIEIRSCYLRLY